MSDATSTQSLRDLLAKYRACELAILNNQSYSINGMTFTRASLETVQKEISRLESRISNRTGRNHASVVFTR